MRFDSRLAAAALLTALLATPTVALAHTKVVASTPAQGATVKAPRVVALTFSEALLPPTAAASCIASSFAPDAPQSLRNPQLLHATGRG